MDFSDKSVFRYAFFSRGTITTTHHYHLATTVVTFFFSLAVKEVFFFTIKIELLAIDKRVHHADTGAKLCFIVELQILFTQNMH